MANGRMEPGFFQWCPVTGPEGHKLKRRRLYLNIRKHFTVRGTALAKVDHRGCRVSLLGDIQKLYGHSPWQPALGEPA